jgi:hypothetical protein
VQCGRAFLGVHAELNPPLLTWQVSKKDLLMTSEGEFLEEMGLIVSREIWRRKEIRTNTKLVYQQRKYDGAVLGAQSLMAVLWALLIAASLLLTWLPLHFPGSTCCGRRARATPSL